MLTDMKIVLIGILAVAIVIKEVQSISEENDEEQNLRQALYLVQLLKTDYLKSLRSDDISDNDNNDVDDSNSTCPDETLNSTTPISNDVPADGRPLLDIGLLHGLPTTTILSSLKRAASRDFDYVISPSVTELSPAALSLLPVTWPASPNPINLAQIAAATVSNIVAQPQVNNPSPNIISVTNQAAYNQPQGYHFRRMMPTYDYYEGPPPSSGNYRRFGNMPVNQPTGEKVLHLKGEYRRDLNTKSTEPIVQPGFRRAGDTDPQVSQVVETQTTGITVTQITNTIADTSVTGVQNITDSVGTKATVQNEIQSVSQKTSQDLLAITNSVQPISMPKLSTTPTVLKISNQGTERPVINSILQAPGKALRADIRKDVQAKKANLVRQGIASDKPTTENQIMSQVASELVNEVQSTRKQNPVPIAKEGDEIAEYYERPIIYKTTMKTFLKGSSRLQIPFSENNAFCHLYPYNKLCGVGL